MDWKIAMLMSVMEEDARRISRVLGVAQGSAYVILAEIGESKQFENRNMIESWAGLCPSVYKTAETNLTGRSKQGS